MLSSTMARATPRMYLSVPPPRAPRHRAHPAWAATVAAARSSRAGGRRRPWLARLPRARDFCAGMRALGCAVALDDFGAGFGAFQYLKHLPFQYLKIDGSFIRGLPRSPHDQLVVKALAGLARSLGSRTIAECVEDAATLRLLGGLGVQHAQGFHVGVPRVLAGA